VHLVKAEIDSTTDLKRTISDLLNAATSSTTSMFTSFVPTLMLEDKPLLRDVADSFTKFSYIFEGVAQGSNSSKKNSSNNSRNNNNSKSERNNTVATL
jgi:hypothetical protein